LVEIRIEDGASRWSIVYEVLEQKVDYLRSTLLLKVRHFRDDFIRLLESFNMHVSLAIKKVSCVYKRKIEHHSSTKQHEAGSLVLRKGNQSAWSVFEFLESLNCLLLDVSHPPSIPRIFLYLKLHYVSSRRSSEWHCFGIAIFKACCVFRLW
jgi:hypothetical protein